MNNIIEVKNLIKKYKKADKNAVDDITFSVKEGSFFALLGPNGAGKTTILSILNTTLSKTSGEINICGYSLDKEPSSIRKNIGVIFQNPSLDLNLTAEENVRFHANLYGLYDYRPTFSMMPAEYKTRIDQLASVLNLTGEEMFKPIKSFSGGMKRKLEIIRGLMHKPKVLFLDEPTTGLDPVSRKNLWTYLQKIRKEEKVTIFLTTHYLDEAEGADEICIINSGRIVAEGSPSRIKERLIDEYIIVDAKNRDALSEELKAMKAKFEGTGPFKIDVLNSKESQQIIKHLKTDLTTLKVYNPTLEEAYINIIEGKHE